jgi:putative membrane protein
MPGETFSMKLGLVTIGLGGALVIGLVAWFGVHSIGREVLEAGWVIPLTSALLAFQLFLSAAAWRIVMGVERPRLGRYVRIRWIREAVNSLLPVAQLGGNLVGIRMLMQRGLPGPLAGAGTTLDLTIETATQLLFVLAGFAVLAVIDADRSWAPWVEWALGTMALGLVGFVIAQRAGLLRIIEWLAIRLAQFFPGLSLDAVNGLHSELMRLHRDRSAVFRATALHFVTWMLGAGETWLALTAMGRPTSLAEAFVIESLGAAARSAGFVVPGALGVQEAGFIVVCDLFGIPPDAAIALSMLKRARELVVGVPGLIAWQWSEGKRLLRQ